MTERRPPPRPPNGPPPLDAYRPRSELPPAPQALRPPQKFPPRPLPPGAQQPRRSANPGTARHRRGDQRWSLGNSIGFTLLGIVSVVAAGIGYLVINPPADLIRSEVIAQVKAMTGRDLRIRGAARFTIYPSVGVSLEQVALSPPPGMGGAPLATMSSLDINVGLVPLFGRRIEVDRVVLRDPVIEFRTDASGRRSWDMRRTADASGHGARPVEVAQVVPLNRATDAPQAGPASESPALSGIGQISLRDVRIENGTVVWHDERTGVREAISSVNLVTGMAAIDRPLEIKGSLVVRGERLDVTGSLGSLVAMPDAQPSSVSLKARNALADVAFDGTLSAGLDAEGEFDLAARDLRGLAAKAGLDLGPATGFRQGSLTGRLRSSPGQVQIEQAQFRLDDTMGSGTIGLDARGARPRITASLDIGALNLNPYLPPRDGLASNERPSASTTAPTAATPSAAERAPTSIEDLLGRPASGGKSTPQVRGFTQRAGWGEEPIRLAALRAFDADVQLRLGQIVYREIKLGQSRMSGALSKGVLKVIAEDVRLYDGRARGAVTIDATSALPRFGASIAGEGVSLQPLLRDAGAKSWIAGAAKFTTAITGEGGTQKEMMDGLAGKAELAVADGAIVGWNLAQIIRGLKQGQLAGLDRVETAKTDFSDLTASWSIAEGVAQNQDLKLNSPLMRVTGAGRVDLGKRQIDFQLKPKLVASLEGQGAAQGLAGLEIPLRVQGPWERPELVPEVGDLLKDPDKAISAVKEIGKQFKGKSANEIVDQVLGDNPEAAKKANDLLNKWLKPR